MPETVPADIAAAIRTVIETQQAFGRVERLLPSQQAIKASFACDDALQALDAAILAHLRGVEELCAQAHELKAALERIEQGV